jgi:hypothetical protein
MKFLIMQFFIFSSYSPPLESKYSPQHPVLEHRQSPLGVRKYQTFRPDIEPEISRIRKRYANHKISTFCRTFVVLNRCVFTVSEVKICVSVFCSACRFCCIPDNLRVLARFPFMAGRGGIKLHHTILS